jgi:hypothetical protein
MQTNNMPLIIGEIMEDIGNDLVNTYINNQIEEFNKILNKNKDNAYKLFSHLGGFEPIHYKAYLYLLKNYFFKQLNFIRDSERFKRFKFATDLFMMSYESWQMSGPNVRTHPDGKEETVIYYSCPALGEGITMINKPYFPCPIDSREIPYKWVRIVDPKSGLVVYKCGDKILRPKELPTQLCKPQTKGGNIKSSKKLRQKSKHRSITKKRKK